MVKRFFGRTVLAFALTLGAAVALSSSAFAQYGYGYGYDDYYDRGGVQQAHQYGYQNGYHDGYRKGQHEGRENDPGDINMRALQEATHGYRRWMGPIEAYQDGYRDGYRSGFRSGYQATNRRWRDRDYDDWRRY
jgi:flagellar biosynthesis/type III secretory pathway protein FliH